MTVHVRWWVRCDRCEAVIEINGAISRAEARRRALELGWMTGYRGLFAHGRRADLCAACFDQLPGPSAGL